MVWLNYEPTTDKNPLLDRVEILPQTWKKYDCKKKRANQTEVFPMSPRNILFLSVPKEKSGLIITCTGKLALCGGEIGHPLSNLKVANEFYAKGKAVRGG